jgi:phosphoribosylformylglycinamidine cyclo-ligase
MLPKPCKVVIDRSSWTPQPIFSYLQKAGQISDREMFRTFNNGLGLVIVVSEEDTSEALLRLKAMGETPYHIGSVESRDDEEEPVQFAG